jgi:hypothetical protein
MSETGTQFWKWFEKNNDAYLFLNQVDENEKEKLLDELLNKLHQYCDKLYFEAGGHPDETQELIITAEGNDEYFNKVEALILLAPELKNWKFIAFIPPKGSDFEINFEGIILDPNQMWFIPLEKSEDKTWLGIEVCIKNHKLIKDKDYFNSAIYKVVETILGEKSFALDINYLQTDQLPENPEELGLIELNELPQYIEWKKSNL